jgi:hypothetical protein
MISRIQNSVLNHHFKIQPYGIRGPCGGEYDVVLGCDVMQIDANGPE